ncbi:MAG: Rid family hydrolase [Ornithinibacter sp.]
MHPQTGALVEGGIDEQTKQVFAKLEAVLTSAGCTCADVIKVNVSLTDLVDFTTVTAIQAGVSTEPHPDRTTVGVAGLPLWCCRRDRARRQSPLIGHHVQPVDSHGGHRAARAGRSRSAHPRPAAGR